LKPKARNLDARLVRELRAGLPRGRRPFASLARRLGAGEAEVLARLRALKADGRLRRVAAIVEQRRLGLRGRILVAWNVPARRLRAASAALAARPEVTHCYERSRRPRWPYNLYTMVHAASQAGCAALIRSWSRRLRLKDYQLLPTVREWKKSLPVYF